MLLPTNYFKYGMVQPLLGIKITLSGPDVPPDSAHTTSRTPSWDLNFSYSFSRTALNCSKFPFFFCGKVTFLLPSPASFNAANDSWDGVLSYSGSDNTQKSCVQDSLG